MKANPKQTAVKLTASKVGSHVMVWVVTKYEKSYLHQVAGCTLMYRNKEKDF